MPGRRSSSPSLQMMLDLAEDDNRSPTAKNSEAAKNVIESAKPVADFPEPLKPVQSKKPKQNRRASSPSMHMMQDDVDDDISEVSTSYSRKVTGDSDYFSSVGSPWSRQNSPLEPDEPAKERNNDDVKKTRSAPKLNRRASSPSMQMMMDDIDDAPIGDVEKKPVIKNKEKVQNDDEVQRGRSSGSFSKPKLNRRASSPSMQMMMDEVE